MLLGRCRKKVKWAVKVVPSYAVQRRRCRQRSDAIPRWAAYVSVSTTSRPQRRERAHLDGVRTARFAAEMDGEYVARVGKTFSVGSRLVISAIGCSSRAMREPAVAVDVVCVVESTPLDRLVASVAL